MGPHVLADFTGPPIGNNGLESIAHLDTHLAVFDRQQQQSSAVFFVADPSALRQNVGEVFDGVAF